MVVVPAGHPFVAVASNNQNLQLLCFEVNAQDNEKFTLAGKNSTDVEQDFTELTNLSCIDIVSCRFELVQGRGT